MDGGDGGLLLGSIGRERAEVAGRLPCALVFVDAVKVKSGEEVDSFETGVGELVEVLHAVGARIGEGEVGSAMRRGNGGVADAEVAHVELIDAEVVDARQGG